MTTEGAGSRPRQGGWRERLREPAIAAGCGAAAVMPLLVLLRSDAYPIGRDMLSYVAPLLRAAAEQGSGIARWDSYTQCGQAMTGNPLGMVFYPLTWLFLPLGLWPSIRGLMLAHYFLAGACGYLLFRMGLRLGRPAAALGAVVLAGSGYLHSMGELFQFLSVPWLLLMAGCWLRLGILRARRRRLALGLGCAAAGAMALLGGQLEQVMAVSAGLVALTAYRCLRRNPEDRSRFLLRPGCLRRIAMPAVLIALGAALACAIPLTQWARDGLNSRRIGGAMPEAEQRAWSTTPDRILDLAIPFRLGIPDQPDHLGARIAAQRGGKAVPWAVSIYLGLPALLLLGLSPRRRHRWLRVPGLAALAVTILLALGGNTWFFPAILKVFPPLGIFRFPEKWLFGATLLVATLAALGLDGAMRRHNRRDLIAAGMAAAVILLLVGGCAAFWSRLPPDWRTPMLRQQFLGQVLMLFAVLAAAGWILFRLCRADAPQALRLGWMLCLLTVADLAWAAQRHPLAVVLPIAPERLPNAILDPARKELDATRGPSFHRVAASLEQFTNRTGTPTAEARLRMLAGAGPGLVGIRSVEGLYANVSRRQDFFSATLREQHPFLFFDLCSARCLIMEASRIQGDPERFGYARLASDPEIDLVLLRNPGAIPRLHVFSEWLVVPSPEEALARMTEPSAGGSRHRHELILEVPPGMPGPPPPSPLPQEAAAAAILAVEEQPGHLVVQVFSPSPAMLYLAENAHPDWSARVDESPVPIYFAHGMFMAVPIPAGTATAEFRFGR